MVEWSNELTFVLNGVEKKLRNPDPLWKLVDYLRDEELLKGTKVACGEGGCGVCTVVIFSKKLKFRAVNACLVRLSTLDGMAVYTIEGLGSKKHGFHAIQERVAQYNATQCGFCTGGWVMNMYELLRQNDVLTKQQVENHFDGNLCRCTGYRPILDAFKSFAVLEIEKDEHQGYRTIEQLESDNEWELIPEMNSCISSQGCSVRTCGSNNCGNNCTSKSQMELTDLEDLVGYTSKRTNPYISSSDHSVPNFVLTYLPKSLCFTSTNVEILWYKPTNLTQLYELFAKVEDPTTVMIVGGFTSTGVTKYFNHTSPYNRDDERSIHIDINQIPEFQTIENRNNYLHIGAAVTINSLIHYFENLNVNSKQETPFENAARHFRQIANNQVRNIATWAGNLAICRSYPEFPSDIAIVFLALNGKLILYNTASKMKFEESIQNYLSMPPVPFHIILEIIVPTLPDSDSKNHFLRCYKITQRSQNAHAHVNAGIMLVKDLVNRNCIESCQIAFGGVSKVPFRATQTESFLKNRNITQEVISKSFEILQLDLKTIGESGTYAFGSTSAFRRSIMENLLYKCMLSTVDKLSTPRLKSARDYYVRPISCGIQQFKPLKATTPLSFPIPKLTGKSILKNSSNRAIKVYFVLSVSYSSLVILNSNIGKLQSSGEAIYVRDVLYPKNTLFGALVYSVIPSGKVLSIDIKRALQQKGVVDVITAADIIGKNDIGDVEHDEQLFVPNGGVVRCIGQCLGVVLATSEDIARKASALVNVKYQKFPSPVIDLSTAIKRGTLFPSIPSQINPVTLQNGDVEKAIESAGHQIEGKLWLGSQRHFYMEPQGSHVKILEDGIVHVETSSQNPYFVQKQVAKVLGLQLNEVIVEVKRAGGGFGGKLTRCVVNAAAAGVASLKHSVPVFVVNDRNTDFHMVGGRENIKCEYKYGFNSDGYVTAVDMNFHVNAGYSRDNSFDSANMLINWSDNAYYVPNYRARAFIYQTNLPTCTSLRAPGVPQGIIILEAIMEEIADFLKLPTTWIQERNMYKDGNETPYHQVLSEVKFPEVWNGLKVQCEYEKKQEVAAYFNSSNLWRKRGLSIVPIKYGMAYSGRQDGAKVQIYSPDGSVVISHSGCEIGQGIHTKAAQAAAYILGIPIKLIKVRSTSTDKLPNMECTGGSSTSESIVRAVRIACAELSGSISSIRKSNPNKTWQEIIQLAHGKGVKLFSSGLSYSTLQPPNLFDYFVYGAAFSEIEYDVLTGEMEIIATEMIYDCGISLNPAIDIGQIEGAFVMGVGLYMQEEVIYSPNGELLSNGTWEYKIPCSQDIPQYFKITLLENGFNKNGIFSSKATGEPPYGLASSVYFALKDALKQIRNEKGEQGFFQLDIPATISRRQIAANIKKSDLII